MWTWRRSRARAVMGKEPQMLKIALLLVLALPGLAGAEMWRWKDAAGQVHYSNVPGHVPSHAATVHRDVGYLAPAPLALEVTPSADLERLREERAIKRRLAVIQAASSEARKTAARPMSAGSPARPSGMVCRTASPWKRISRSPISERTRPGAITFTRTPALATSLASTLASAFTPALAT